MNQKTLDKLLNVDDVLAALQSTEPLTTEFLSNDSKIKFQLQPDWAVDFDNLNDTDAVAAEITVNGKATQLSKEALLLAASNVGISKAYTRRTPSHLIEDNLNYWYGGGMGDKQYNMLVVKGVASAFIAPTKAPYSNVDLVEMVIDGVWDKMGEVNILADYKFNHSLQKTDVRLIIPEYLRTIDDTHMSDTDEDEWSAGIHISNSLIGKTQTSVEGYTFRWANGAGATSAVSVPWNRRHEAASEVDVYTWAKHSAIDALDIMEKNFDDIQLLTSLDISNNTVELLRDIYTEFNVPVTQRSLITEAMIGVEERTMYSLMNAIIETANEAGLDPDRVDRMMRIGGYVPSATFDNVKARIFAEGQEAGPEAPNKYAFGVLP